MKEEKPCISTIQQCIKASKNSHIAESGSEEEELILEGKAITGYKKEQPSQGFKARIMAARVIFPAASFTCIGSKLAISALSLNPSVIPI